MWPRQDTNGEVDPDATGGHSICYLKEIEGIDGSKVEPQSLDAESGKIGLAVYKESGKKLFDELVNSSRNEDSGPRKNLLLQRSESLGLGRSDAALRDRYTTRAGRYQNKIFDIFQTLQSRDQVESTGIGLSIVKKRLETMGGSIQVRSKAGQGSSFIIHLPKNKAPHQD